MSRVVFRTWVEGQQQAPLLAIEAAKAARAANSGTRVICLRLLSDPHPDHDTVLRHFNDLDIPYITVVEREKPDTDDGPEMDAIVKKWDDMVAFQKNAMEQTARQRNSGRRQFLPAGTVVHIKGVPYKLTGLTEVEGNTDFHWVKDQPQAILNPRRPGEYPDFDVAHDVQYIQECVDHEKAHPVRELTDEERKAFLKAMYEGDGFEGYT